MRPNLVGWGLATMFFVGGALFVIFVREAWLLGTIWMVVAAFLFSLYAWMSRRADQADELKREGVRGRARVLDLTQTGTYINENPRVKLRLHVDAPGVPQFEVTHTYTVPLVALGAFAAGDSLPVYMDPADPKKFTIDWLGGSGKSTGGDDTEERLKKLDKLRSDGLITQAEYDERRTKVLDAI
jgi:Short C-terminal domain